MSLPNSNAPAPAAPPSGTQKRTNGSRASYPRKRALLACQTCRQRKVKCDNQRPTCGGCEELEIDCVFLDSKKDHSRYDPASLEILERINYIARLIETQHDAIPEHILASAALVIGSPFSPNSGRAGSHVLPPDRTPSSSADHVSSHHTYRADPDGQLESLEFTGTNPGVSEDVLNWPIFGIEYNRALTQSLIFNPSPTNGSPTPLHTFDPLASGTLRTSKPGRGVQEEDIARLVNVFLINVHPKNPVLDPENLKSEARLAAVNGFGWDATSCLVLIVCALASLSSSFRPDPVVDELVEGPKPISSLDDTPEYSTAESYYVAAQKRIALLDNSVTTTQCYFLTGVYEMYSLRPAKAWTSFNRACITLQIYFKGHERQELLGPKGVVSRLYWSCLKSECELRMEIALPPSGLANVAYPDTFPTPPCPEPSAEALSGAPVEFASRPESYPSRALEPDLEKIWSYYLSELAVRKIGNRIMNCFYKDGETSWLTMPLDRMIRVAEELELQITQWFENLPSTLAAVNTADTRNTLATEELQFVLHARLFDFRERIYRPFLYLALHHPAEDGVHQTIAPFVQRCVGACLACLLRGTPRHRHHGTWYENRGMFLKSLLIVAAIKSGKVQVPDLWQQGVNLCIAGFKFWELEAPDLREARQVLENLVATLGMNHV